MMGSEPESSEKRGHESGFPSEEEIEPLMNCPYFTVNLLKTHVKNPYKLGIPALFLENHPNHIAHVVLSRRGKTWEMDHLGVGDTHRRFSPEWKNFVLDNNLKVGDGCVFELMECKDGTAKFKVQVLRGDLPKDLLEKIESVGKSSDTPIVLDD